MTLLSLFLSYAIDKLDTPLTAMLMLWEIAKLHWKTNCEVSAWGVWPDEDEGRKQ
jgi:hypothetical protein